MIRDWKPDTVISAIPNILPPDELQHLSVPIDDIYNVLLISYKQAIRKVLACRGDRLLIHCEHGQSRSAALAIIKLYSEDPNQIEEWFHEHPEAQPNPLLLLLGDEILQADGDLLKRCRGHYKGCQF